MNNTLFKCKLGSEPCMMFSEEQSTYIIEDLCELMDEHDIDSISREVLYTTCILLNEGQPITHAHWILLTKLLADLELSIIQYAYYLI